MGAWRGWRDRAIECWERYECRALAERVTLAEDDLAAMLTESMAAPHHPDHRAMARAMARGWIRTVSDVE